MSVHAVSRGEWPSTSRPRSLAQRMGRSSMCSPHPNAVAIPIPRAEPARSATREQVLHEARDVFVGLAPLLHELGDLLVRVDDRGVVTPAELLADLWV